MAWLKRQGVSCDTAANRGWRGLTNGLLAEAAYRAGFRVLLTRDRDFGMAAGKVLGSLADLAVVIITLPQAREAAYLAEFEARWRETPIRPAAGKVIEWP